MKHHQLLYILSIFAFAGCKTQTDVKPQRKDIVDAVFGSGHIENKDQYVVMANTDGYLKQAWVAEGDSVHAGQKLFRLKNDVQQTQVGNALTNLNYAKTNTSPGSPQIEQLKIQIAQAQDKAAVDSTNYARYQRLVQTSAVSKADFDNVQLQYRSSTSNLHVLQKNLSDLQRNLNLSLANARSQYQVQQQSNDYYSITASAPGLVLSVSKKVGDYVKKGDAIAQVGAGNTLIKLYIAEDDIQRIKLGQTALISLNSSKTRVYKAVITKIYPVFDLNQQAFTVEAKFNEQPGQLINGTQLQGNIIVQEKKNVLVIPSYYLLNGDYVLTKKSKDKVPVKVGIRTLEWTEITDGLTENDILLQPKQN